MNFKAVIAAPRGSHAYTVFEAVSLEDARQNMQEILLTLALGGRGQGGLVSLEPTEEATFDGFRVIHWAPNQREQLPAGYLITIPKEETT